MTAEEKFINTIQEIMENERARFRLYGIPKWDVIPDTGWSRVQEAWRLYEYEIEKAKGEVT